MFFLTYLGRELQRRSRQAILVALGLALGVGLVITVTAVADGVKVAQASVVHALYGIGTAISVTEAPAAPKAGHPPPGAIRIKAGQSEAGQTIETLGSPTQGTMHASEVSRLARLKGVSAAAGGFELTDTKVTLPASLSSGSPPTPQSFTIDGVNISHLGLGPLSSGRITSGKTFSSGEADSDVAVVNSDYATAHGLHVGSKLTITGQSFTVIGIVTQPQASTPPDIYIPLARAQALYAAKNGTSGDLVNTIYLATANASDVSSVQHEIQSALPSATVSSSSSLAGDVSGSLATTATLANDLGRWLAVLVLIAAVLVAILLTMGAVTRRVREFGTLKALGWRSRRIIGQVLGESLATGVLGAALGVGLGEAATRVITAVAPELSETVGSSPPGSDGGGVTVAPAGAREFGRHLPQATIPVHLTAPVSAEIILVALVLAVAGALIAGCFASWRIARLRPAHALARVE